MTALAPQPADVTPRPPRFPRDSLCRTRGHPSWWDAYVDQGDDNKERGQARARRLAAAAAVCDRCPVKDLCLADALARHAERRDVGGVRGGWLFGDGPVTEVPRPHQLGEVQAS